MQAVSRPTDLSAGGEDYLRSGEGLRGMVEGLYYIRYEEDFGRKVKTQVFREGSLLSAWLHDPGETIRWSDPATMSDLVIRPDAVFVVNKVKGRGGATWERLPQSTAGLDQVLREEVDKLKEGRDESESEKTGQSMYLLSGRRSGKSITATEVSNAWNKRFAEAFEYGAGDLVRSMLRGRYDESVGKETRERGGDRCRT